MVGNLNKASIWSRRSMSLLSYSSLVLLPSPFSCFCFFLFINFIGAILVNKIIQVQVHSFTTHHVYILLCAHHPKLRLCPSPLISLYPPPLHSIPPPWQSPHCCPAHKFFLIFFYFAQSLTFLLFPSFIVVLLSSL